MRTPWTLSLLVFCLSLSARAATFVVDSTLDAVDASPGDGACATAAATCTLRAAVQETNALAGADTVQLPAGTYTLTIPQVFPDTPAVGDLDISGDVTIQASPGARIESASSSLVAVQSGHVRLSGLVLGPTSGGCLSNDARLILEGVSLEDCSLFGLSNGGVLSARDLEISGTVQTPGVDNTGVMVIVGGALHDNFASAVENSGGGRLALYNVSIYGNWPLAPLTGTARGVTNQSGVVTLHHVSIDHSTMGPLSTDVSSLLCSTGSEIRVTSSLLIGAENIEDNCWCDSIVSGGGNVYSEPGSTSDDCVASGSDAEANVALNVDTSGPTPTLVPSNPADPAAVDTAPAQRCPLRDQRGLSRPAGAGCDVGAAEVAGGPPRCSDAADNDGDGLVDANDPGCVDAADPLELELEPGDLVVVDGEDASVKRVDPGTGEVATLTRGLGLLAPWGVALEAFWLVLVTDWNTYGALRIDPGTGDAELVTGIGDIFSPRGLSLDPNGQPLVTSGADRIVRVDPESGAQTVVSQVAELGRPTDVLFDPNDGTLLVADDDIFNSGDGVLRIDTGPDVVVERWVDNGPGPLSNPGQLAFDPNGDLLVAGDGLLLDTIVHIDVESGAETLLTPTDLPGAEGVALEASGQVITAGETSGVWRVDPASGTATLLAAAPGPLVEPKHVAVVPGSPDSDGDGIPNDGDASGVAGDSPCSCSAPGVPAGCAVGCDDNCAHRANPDQVDRGGVASPQYVPGDGSPDGAGDVCQCGDMNGDGIVNGTDVVLYRRRFAGQASPFSSDRCSVTGPDGSCDASDVVVMRRTFGGQTAGILSGVCPAALGLSDPLAP